MDERRAIRGGTAGALEGEAYDFCLACIRKYRALHNPHLTVDVINGIIRHAHTRAMRRAEVDDAVPGHPRPRNRKEP